MPTNWNDPQDILKRRQKAIEAGYKPKDVDEFIATKKKQQATLELGQQGVIDPSELAKTDPQTALKLVQEPGYKPKPTDAEKKAENASAGVLGFIDTLKNFYNQPNAAGARPNINKQDDLSAAQKPGVIGTLQGWKLGIDAALNAAPDAKTYKRIKDGFTASLKEATGDTGVLTDQDYARIAHALPDFGDTDETARKAWEAVDQILVSKFGKTGKFSYLPQEQPPQNNGSIVGNVDTGAVPISPIAQEPAQEGLAVQTARQRQDGGILDNILKGFGASAPQNTPIASILQNPQFQELFKLLHPGVSTSMEKLSQGQLPNQGEATDAGIDVGSSALLGGGLKVISKLAQPFKLIGAMKEAAVLKAAGKTIEGNKVYQALEKGAENLSPTVKQGYLKFLEQAAPELKGKKLPIEQAVNIASNANDAYTAAGKVGKAANAKFNDVLSKVLRGEIKTVAPDVSSANDLFRMLYRGQKVGGKAAGIAGGGIAAGAGVYMLNRLLGGR